MSISVIIPAYNAEKYLAEAIESALHQTRPAKEIVVVDDGSSDRTREVVQSFGEKVRIIQHEANQGVGAARNTGVAASDGDYVAFLDADDKWLPEHLENLAGLLDMWPETGLAFCQIEFVGRKSGMWPERIDGFLEPRAAFFDMLRNIVCVPSAMMVRRRIHEHIGGFDAAPVACGFAARRGTGAPRHREPTSVTPQLLMRPNEFGIPTARRQHFSISLTLSQVLIFIKRNFQGHEFKTHPSYCISQSVSGTVFAC